LPGCFKENDAQPDLFLELSIEKQKIFLREAWEIEANDPDIVALRADDNPIIPNEVKNAPVLNALNKIRQIDKRLS
jgi:hypothetical protein